MKRGRGRLRLGDTSHDVEVERTASGWRVVVDGEEFALAGTLATVDPLQNTLRVGGEDIPFRVEAWDSGAAAANGAAGGHARVRSPMSGKLVELKVKEGTAVGKGDVLFVLEAMKMQNEVRSPAAGTVTAVRAKAGETLDTERVVLEIAPRA
jgi:biotin carboxyl carrier protein